MGQTAELCSLLPVGPPGPPREQVAAPCLWVRDARGLAGLCTWPTGLDPRVARLQFYTPPEPRIARLNAAPRRFFRPDIQLHYFPQLIASQFTLREPGECAALWGPG